MNVVLFENSHVAELTPLSLTRPTFDIFCGGTTLYDLLKKTLSKSFFTFKVRDHLIKVMAEERKQSFVTTGDLLFIDGAIVPNIKIINRLAKAVARQKSFVVKDGNDVVAAFINCRQLKLLPMVIKKLRPEQVQEFLASFKLPRLNLSLTRFNYPWEVIVQNAVILEDNLELLRSGLKQLKSDVFVGKNVKIAPYTVFDTSNGVVVVDSNTNVEPFTVLRGPLYIGRGCLIKSFAEIKNSSMGDVCKLGGEVEGCVLQGYANKQHYGYLGHAYVGSWVNLGAGTTNSDLKNTYGKIKMAGRETSQQFLGCIIGDYSKTAIGTLIFTGKIVGVNSLLYGTVTKDVPSFTNFAAKLVECPLAVAWKMQKVVRARRGFKTSPAQRRVLAEVYKFTNQERSRAMVSKGKVII